MKRLVAIFALFALPLTAQASPQLAQDWGGKAASLHAETTALITEIDSGLHPEIDLTYLIEIERFAATAGRLGSWIDTSEGPADLGCIFRGMAAEGERQINTLDTANDLSDRRTALRRLATMFADAEMIAVATSRQRLRTSETAAHTCPADPAMVFSALD